VFKVYDLQFYVLGFRAQGHLQRVGVVSKDGTVLQHLADGLLRVQE